MNICFFIGEIITNTDFKFFINNPYHISVASFKIRLSNNTILLVKAYDEKADFFYRNLKNHKKIFVIGRITSTLELEIIESKFV